MQRIDLSISNLRGGPIAVFEHVTTLESFRRLDPKDQRACAEDKKAAVNHYIREYIDECFSNRELEKQLVPQISTRPAAPAQPEVVNLHPPVPEDIDSQARDFFRRFPETKEIRVGNTIYERGGRR